MPPMLCGRDASRWLRGDPVLQQSLAQELIAFELRDDVARSTTAKNRFAGEWALVTHQMTALGLAQLCLAHPEWKERYVPMLSRAAQKSFLPEMRDASAGVRGMGKMRWRVCRERTDTPTSATLHSLWEWLGVVSIPNFPKSIADRHDALIAAYERRLLASATGLIETYPGEAYPTDVAAVAAAIAVHGRVTGENHHRVLAHWAERVKRVQIDAASGLVIQRMGARSGKPHDAPRGSGTGLAAYFAGFADRRTAQLLADGLFKHESTFFGFGAIREYASGHHGFGDIDSGPVIFGVSVSATGFALAPARAFGKEDSLRANLSHHPFVWYAVQLGGADTFYIWRSDRERTPPRVPYLRSRGGTMEIHASLLCPAATDPCDRGGLLSAAVYAVWVTHGKWRTDHTGRFGELRNR
ncbi:MAG: hypothetical protein V9E98_12020 [Candidatus Nanopelagicales bacterium]